MHRLFQRIVSLIGGPAYLGLLSVVFSYLTNAPIGVTAVVVVGCAAIVLVSIGLLCVRFAGRTEKDRRFRLATVLLLFVPFAVYLGATRYFLLAIEGQELKPAMWIMLAVWCLLFMAITTVALLFFGEALVWLATSVRQTVIGRRSNEHYGRIDRERCE